MGLSTLGLGTNIVRAHIPNRAKMPILVMRRAAAHLASLALLVFLPSLLVAKAEPTQTYNRGVQSLAVLTTLPRAYQIAPPRSATQPVQLSPVIADPNAFIKEFYGTTPEPQSASSAASAPITEFTPVSVIPAIVSQPQ